MNLRFSCEVSKLSLYLIFYKNIEIRELMCNLDYCFGTHSFLRKDKSDGLKLGSVLACFSAFWTF